MPVVKSSSWFQTPPNGCSWYPPSNRPYAAAVYQRSLLQIPGVDLDYATDATSGLMGYHVGDDSTMATGKALISAEPQKVGELSR